MAETSISDYTDFKPTFFPRPHPPTWGKLKNILKRYTGAAAPTLPEGGTIPPLVSSDQPTRDPTPPPGGAADSSAGGSHPHCEGTSLSLVQDPPLEGSHQRFWRGLVPPQDSDALSGVVPGLDEPGPPTSLVVRVNLSHIERVWGNWGEYMLIPKWRKWAFGKIGSG